MKEQRKTLIDKFQAFLDTKPRQQIIAAGCANIAENYHSMQLLQTDVMWRCFSEEIPEVNRKIFIDLDGDIFESSTKMEYNLDKKLILMADMRQENGDSWFVGMSWFKKFKWCYNVT